MINAEKKGSPGSCVTGGSSLLAAEIRWMAGLAPHLNFAKALEQAEADAAAVPTEGGREADQ